MRCFELGERRGSEPNLFLAQASARAEVRDGGERDRNPALHSLDRRVGRLEGQTRQGFAGAACRGSLYFLGVCAAEASPGACQFQTDCLASRQVEFVRVALRD